MPRIGNNLNVETENEVCYFTSNFEPLDSFSAHATEIWGKVFLTVEHAYQWKKYSVANPEIAQMIYEAKSPYGVKKISNVNKQARSEGWEENKLAVMEEIYRAKAAQHEDVREALKRTGKRTIIENSPVDSYWGAGPEGDGENWLGKIWMKTRDELFDS